jgi:hypothetical protein
MGKMSNKQDSSHKPIYSLRGFKIRWCKEAKLSQTEKQKIKKDLHHMSEKIMKVMNGTKEEDSRREVGEMRFRLSSFPHSKVYLTIEYCNNAWHIFMETFSDCIGEIVCEGGSFIQMLKKEEVEEETL